MDMSIFLVLLELVCMAAAAVLAKRKGYSTVLWLVAANPLAVIVLLSQPSTISGPYPLADERDRRRRINRIGIFLIIVNLIVVVWLLASMNHTTSDAALFPPDHVFLL
jgi:hypothetical protein